MTINRFRRAALAAAGALVLAAFAAPALADGKIPLRISTPAVPEDWHAKMWTVFKEQLDKSAPEEVDRHRDVSSVGRWFGCQSRRGSSASPASVPRSASKAASSSATSGGRTRSQPLSPLPSAITPFSAGISA